LALRAGVSLPAELLQTPHPGGNEERDDTMTTHADLAARLLREAATMFRAMGGPDAQLSQRLDEFAALYDQVADLVEADPLAELQPAVGGAG
jgi:hypothetical protein